MDLRLFLKITVAVFLLTLLGAVVMELGATKNEPLEPAAKEEAPEVEHATIVFVGDMMFDRYIRKKGEELGYERIMEAFMPTFSAADAVVGNLEGPITTSSSVSLGALYPALEHFTFTFDPAVAGLLKQHNFAAVSLANNHSTNFGRSGVKETREFLTEASVTYFGDPYKPEGKTAFLTLREQKFAFIGFNQFTEPTIEDTVEAIQAADDRADWVVVYPHWGDEYEPEPNPREIERARSFVDAGADLIIGAHPHVIQTQEIYKGVPIYYSLGNFVFDQYFEPAVRCGLVLTATFNSTGELTLKETTSFLSEDGRTLKRKCSS